MSENLIEKIPQKYPFLLVDEILEMGTDYCRVKKKITSKEWYFEGHFPDRPIMPGCLMIECMAQSAEVMLLSDFTEDMVIEKAYLIQVKNVKFYSPVVPDADIYIECFLTRRIGKMVEVEANIKDKQNKIVSKGKLILMMETGVSTNGADDQQ